MHTVQALIPPVPKPRETITQRLHKVHEIIRSRYPAVTRIAIAVYDEDSDQLCTFSSSSIVDDPLVGYARPLHQVPSLENLARSGATQVVEDIQGEFADQSEHSHWLRAQGFVCSLTKPLFFGDALVGFLFFDAVESGVFDEHSLDYFGLISHLAVELYFSELSVIRTIKSMAKIARDIVHIRDIETGLHLDRMALFSRTIARQLAPVKQLSDEFIEHIFLFAPLHDLGKIGIPDSILLKPGKLTEEEYKTMNGHVEIGVQMIDQIIADLGVAKSDYVEMMRNVILGHHETMDGAGYPRGLKGDQIPLEARIVSVADIFDALTSARPYRTPWSNDRAVQELQRLAEVGRIDPECVAALCNGLPEIVQIQAKFAD